MVRRAPVGLARMDFAGRILFANRCFAQILERPEASVRRLTLADITHRRHLRRDRRYLGRLAEGASPFTVETRYRMPDGDFKWVEASFSAAEDERGRPAWAILAVRDIAERRRRQELIKENRRTFLQLADNIEDVLWVKDIANSKVMFVNAAYEKLWGCTPRDLYADWADWLRTVVPDDRERVRAAHDASMTLGSYDETYRIHRADGALRWIRDRGWVIPPESGPARRVAGIAMDITDQMEKQERDRRIRSELNHRIRNTMSAVIAIASQTALRSPSVEVFTEAFNGRLMALAAAHSTLTRSNWRSASLRDLIRQVLQPFASENGVLTLTGPEVSLSPRQTLGLSLVFHELATNAVKHGAWRVAEGRVAVLWSLDRAESELWLRIEWREQGGPEVHPPQKRGFGSDLIEKSVSYDLRGHSEQIFDRQGLRCEISIPLSVPAGGSLDREPGAMSPEMLPDVR